MCRVIVVVALAACGRVGFDARGVDGGGVGTRTAYIKPSATTAGAEFGARLAISNDGTTLAVGAMLEDAVYVFRRAGATWTQEARVVAATTVPGDQFARSLALSGDGATLAVTANRRASQTGAAYVFTRANMTWTQQAVLAASNAEVGDDFGTSVALSGDGSVLAVGAFYEASAATGVGGNQADNNAAKSGAVYVFTQPSPNAWAQQAYIKASNTGADDEFGEAVALSGDGRTLVVGAPLEDSAATGIDGNQADNSMNEAGAVYVFTGPAWAQQAYVKPSNTHLYDAGGSYFQFGWSVSLAGDGNTLAVGARLEPSAATGFGGNQADNTAGGAGAVYTFSRAGTTWSQGAYVKASNTGTGDFFGETVALSRDGSTLGVTAPNEDGSAAGLDGADNNDAIDSGAVYVFGGARMQTHYVKPTNTSAGDIVSAVALSRDGTVLAIGAPHEDSAATGIDGDQLDNSVADSGAVYIWY